MCGKGCKGKGANAVDHILERKKHPHLAYTLSNLQLLCTLCHNSTKKMDEMNPTRGASVTGGSNNPEHAWYGYE